MVEFFIPPITTDIGEEYMEGGIYNLVIVIAEILLL